MSEEQRKRFDELEREFSRLNEEIRRTPRIFWKKRRRLEERRQEVSNERFAMDMEALKRFYEAKQKMANLELLRGQYAHMPAESDELSSGEESYAMALQGLVGEALRRGLARQGGDGRLEPLDELFLDDPDRRGEYLGLIASIDTRLGSAERQIRVPETSLDDRLSYFKEASKRIGDYHREDHNLFGQEMYDFWSKEAAQAVAAGYARWGENGLLAAFDIPGADENLFEVYKNNVAYLNTWMRFGPVVGRLVEAPTAQPEGQAAGAPARPEGAAATGGFSEAAFLEVQGQYDGKDPQAYREALRALAGALKRDPQRGGWVTTLDAEEEWDEGKLGEEGLVLKPGSGYGLGFPTLVRKFNELWAEANNAVGQQPGATRSEAGSGAERAQGPAESGVSTPGGTAGGPGGSLPEGAAGGLGVVGFAAQPGQEAGSRGGQRRRGDRNPGDTAKPSSEEVLGGRPENGSHEGSDQQPTHDHQAGPPPRTGERRRETLPELLSLLSQLEENFDPRAMLALIGDAHDAGFVIARGQDRRVTHVEATDPIHYVGFAERINNILLRHDAQSAVDDLRERVDVALGWSDPEDRLRALVALQDEVAEQLRETAGSELEGLFHERLVAFSQSLRPLIRRARDEVKQEKRARRPESQKGTAGLGSGVPAASGGTRGGGPDAAHGDAADPTPEDGASVGSPDTEEQRLSVLYANFDSELTRLLAQLPDQRAPGALGHLAQRAIEAGILREAPNHPLRAQPLPDNARSAAFFNRMVQARRHQQ